MENFNIQEELKKLPGKPGVYLMHDEKDAIIYVGKAISLKNRVRQYFQSSRNKGAKIEQMVTHISRFEYIVTDSELEALVLECNLIKEHRPKYNTMLMDDKSYPFIKVTVNEPFPRVMLARQMKKDKAKYFGPYTSAGAVKDTIELIRKLYHIRSCNRSLPKDIGKERPCLNYHIHQCQAPCQGYISQEEYRKSIDEVVRFLNGHYDLVLKELEEKGLTKEEAEAQSTLMAEAREMLRKWEAGDAEVRALWEKMNSWVYAGFDETYKMMGVDFDKIYYESQTYLEGKGKVMEGLEKGVFYRREDGSVWADLTKDGLDEKLLLRADGTSVYMTQDIGTAKLRFDDYPINKMIYVVGNEQNYHFQVLSILLDKLGFEFGKGLVHFSYGMVELPEGKMKSREGTVVDADDLMEEMIGTAHEISQELGKLDEMTPEEAANISRIVGLGSLKYFILKVDPRKNMTFNPKESIDFNGNTGPFIQYTYARIRSVLRKATEQGIVLPKQLPANTPISEKEEGLVQMIADYAVTVKEAGKEYSPAYIANYIYDLVKEYNQFYHDFSILREENPEIKQFRLVLSENVAKVVKSGMSLLGIEVPERM